MSRPGTPRKLTDVSSARAGRGARSTLDHRAPLVVDTRELGRRPGSMRRLTLGVPAPGDLGTPLVGVPEGAELGLDLRLEAVMEGVLVTASVRAPLQGECGRCLEPFTDSLEVDLQELYVYPERLAEAGGDPDDDDTRLLDGDLLDLEPAVRDAVVLALPLTPLCAPGCPGLDHSGERLAEAPAGDSPPVDQRWAALASLADGAAGGTR